ncbi:MAG TPA: antibiotic biosynthesis monooxygenase [Sphingomonadales bacterium]
MTVTFISRMKVFPEKEALFRDLCRQMEEAVRQNEPDTLYFRFYRLDGEHRYAVIESFKNEAAEEAHLSSPHFKAIGPDMIACLDGGYEREYLHPLQP